MLTRQRIDHIEMHTQEQLKYLTLQELIEIYNAMAAVPIAEFETKNDAIKAVAQLHTPIDFFEIEMSVDTSHLGHTVPDIGAFVKAYARIASDTFQLPQPQQNVARRLPQYQYGTHEKTIDIRTINNIQTVDLSKRNAGNVPIKKRTARGYKRKHAGYTQLVRSLFPNVGIEHTIDDLQEWTSDYPWKSIVVCMSALKSRKHGMIIEKQKARGTYKRIQ